MTLPHAIAVFIAWLGGGVALFAMAALLLSDEYPSRNLGMKLVGAAAILFAAATIIHFLALVR